MNVNIEWKEFWDMYYDKAIEIAEVNMARTKKNSRYWDSLIDEDAIIIDAVTESLQKAYEKYDSAKGEKMEPFIWGIIRNEILKELSRETRSLSTLRDIDPKQEADYSIKRMASRIPEESMDKLKEQLWDAIRQLSPIDQSIIFIYLNNPKDYVEDAVNELGVTESFVKTHKCRALDRLPYLMKMTKSDYFDLYEDRPSFGYVQAMVQKGQQPAYRNPIYPPFDMEATVSLLANAIIATTR